MAYRDFLGVVDLTPYQPKRYWKRQPLGYHMEDHLAGVLKSQLLLFNRVGIINLEDQLKWISKSKYDFFVNEIDYLVSKDLIINIESGAVENSNEDKGLYSSISRQMRELEDQYDAIVSQRDKSRILDELKISRKLEALDGISSFLRCRTVASNLRSDEFDAYASFWGGWRLAKTSSDRQSVVELIIGELPHPDPITPWDEIFAFREDFGSKRRLDWLRQWIGKVANANADPNDLAIDLSVALGDYKHSLRKHLKAKSRLTLKTILNTAIDLVGTNPVTALKNPVDFVFNNSTIMDAEPDWKGREVAIIETAKYKFSPRSKR